MARIQQGTIESGGGSVRHVQNPFARVTQPRSIPARNSYLWRNLLVDGGFVKLSGYSSTPLNMLRLLGGD